MITTDPDPAFEPDLLVVCDCGALDRLGALGERNAALFARLPRVIVDHHASNTEGGPDDWVDPAIFDHVQAWLGEAGSRRRFAAQGLGQDLLLICKQPEQIGAINRATGLHFKEHLNI